MTVTYQFGDKLYLNITNSCPCACIFCIRDVGDGVGDGDNLWLERDPTAAEVIADLKTRDLESYRELVFCGYGEPTENLDVMLETCRWIKSSAQVIPVRLNTNGLCDLRWKKPVAPMLSGLIDTISISLNAPDAKRFQEVTNSSYGEKSFDAMLKFAADCKSYVPNTLFSVVDVISPEEIELCRKIADKMGIPLRIREKI